jgi:hypothetical protein
LNTNWGKQTPTGNFKAVVKIVRTNGNLQWYVTSSKKSYIMHDPGVDDAGVLGGVEPTLLLHQPAEITDK